MTNRIVNPNAREALNQMKMEIANELGIEVDMGKDELIRQYYKNK